MSQTPVCWKRSPFSGAMAVLSLAAVLLLPAGSPPLQAQDYTHPVGSDSFSIPDLGGWSITSSGPAETVRVGYGRIRANTGSPTPSGIAIFQFRNRSGVLISEAGVPAAEPVQEGRIFAEVNGPVNTGLAIANPNDVPATIRFYFTDTDGTNVGSGAFELGASTSRLRSSWISRHSTVEVRYWEPSRLNHQLPSLSSLSGDSPTKPVNF